MITKIHNSPNNQLHLLEMWASHSPASLLLSVGEGIFKGFWENWENGYVLGRPVVDFVDLYLLRFRRSFPLKHDPYQPWSINHSILFPGKIKAKPLPQSNAFFEFHFKVKAFLKYLGWFISSVPLSIHVFLHLSLFISIQNKIK